MHPVVFALLIVALVVFIISWVPALAGSRYHLWAVSALAAVLAIVLHLFVLGGAR